MTDTPLVRRCPFCGKKLGMLEVEVDHPPCGATFTTKCRCGSLVAIPIARNLPPSIV